MMGQCADCRFWSDRGECKVGDKVYFAEPKENFDGYWLKQGWPLKSASESCELFEENASWPS